MEVYDVRFLKEALEDLEEIVLYIAQDSRHAALRLHDKIIVSKNGERRFPSRVLVIFPLAFTK